MATSPFIFITGGVRSGKSTFAEQLAISFAKEKGGHLHYIATSETVDDEMKERIKRHQEERKRSSLLWRTWEQPVQIEKIAPFFGKGDILLLDCLTTLVNNEMYLFDREIEEIFHRVKKGIFSFIEQGSTLIVVSNEVGFEPIDHHHELVLNYCSLIGKLHRAFVEKANRAYLVESGIPILMKNHEIMKGEETFPITSLDQK